LTVHREESTLSDILRLGIEAAINPNIVVKARRDEQGKIVDFDYVEVSDLACHHLGFERDKVLASTTRSLLPAEFAGRLVSWLSDVVESDNPVERFDVPFFNTATKELGRFDVRAVSAGDFVGYSFRDQGEVRELADRYRLLLENSSDIVVRTSVEGNIEWIFDAGTSVLGYTPQELMGVAMPDLMHPDDVAARRDIREQMISEEIVRFRLRIRGKDGQYHHFSALAHPVLDANGVLGGVIAGLHLIDDEVSAEEAARISDDRYRLMAEYGTDVIAMERHGAIEWVSPYVERLLNLTSADVVGRSLAELVHPDDRSSLQTFYRGVENVEPLTLTLRMRMADSSYQWVSMRSHEVTDEVTGGKIRVSSWRDAQGDVASQRALMASESRFRLLAENATDVVIECDAEGVVHWISPSAQPTLGWRGENVVGTRVDDHIFPADKDRLTEQRVQISTRHSSVPVEVRYLTPTGNVKWMSQQMRQVRGLSGQTDTIIVGLHDIDDVVNLRFSMAESEKIFRLLAENVTDVVYTVNLEGEILWASPSVVKQLGWQASDMVGHSVLDVIFPEDRTRVVAWRQLLHFGEVLESLTIRVRQASGDFVWMKVRAQATRDSDGRVTGVVAALRDCEVEVVTSRALRTISAGSRVLMRVDNVHELLRQMCQVAVEEGGYLLAWYGKRMDDDVKSVKVFASSIGHESYLEGLEIHWSDDDFGHGPTGRAMRSGQTSTSSDIDTDISFAPWRDNARRHGFRSAAAIPVMVNGQVDGTWQVYAMEPGAFTPDVLTVLEDLALEIGYGLTRLGGTKT
jgi:PAS domain S-box-containing protein